MSEHIVSPRVYYTIFGVLMLGTGLTIAASYADLDPLFHGANTVVALTIAVVKATFVVLYFMHLRYSTRLTVVAALAGIFWLGIMFLFTAADYRTRPHEYYTGPGVPVERPK
jgi:cytochrome c oxidase subunit 4